MELPLKTTTLGAFPKPNYVPVRDWFDLARKTGGMNTAETTRQYSADIEKIKLSMKNYLYVLQKKFWTYKSVQGF
jgi:hypothetical protein